MKFNPHHQALIKIFKANQNPQPNNNWLKHYLGTSKTLYQLKTEPKVKLVKNYLKNQNLSEIDFQKILISLSNGTSFEELSTIGIILNYYQKYRQNLPITLISKLFDHTEGWAETDITCCFAADDLLSRWSEWQSLLIAFSTDPNIHKRRASLVLLTLPNRQSDDSKISQLSFKIIETLKSETNILITKAISWLLRSLIKYNQPEVYKYIENNRQTLPKIAYRETFKKITTGRKNG